MNIRVKVIPHGQGLITRDENTLICQWANEAFGGLDVCKAFHYQSGADLCILAYHDDQLVGFSAVFKRAVRVGRRAVSMGCVGGVITCPEHRGCGIGTIMLKGMDNLIFDVLECEVGGLLCEAKVVPFYERLGWVRSSNSAWVERDGDPVEWPEAFMYHAGAEGKRYTGEFDLCGRPW